MNTHDNDIELPPLPDLPAYSPEVFDREVKVVSETVAEQLMHDYARAAIEADRKRRTPPNEPFAIVIDRMYDGEGPSLAYWNGENYQFTDGDCYEREGDTLDGYTAEFLTDHQLEKRLFDDLKRRGEPVVLATYHAIVDESEKHILHDTRTNQLEIYDEREDAVKAAPDHLSVVPVYVTATEGPLYTTPQPAEPVKTDSAGYTHGPSSDGGMDPRDRTTLNDPIETSIRRFELLAADRNHGAVDPLVGAQELRAYKDSLAPQPKEPLSLPVACGSCGYTADPECLTCSPQPAEPSGASNLHKDSCGAQNENQAPQPAEPVPKGWKLVPETPTSKQIVHMACQIKGADADGTFRTDGNDWPEHVAAAERAYKWALSEAPQPTESARGEPVAWRWQWKDLPDSGWQLSSVGGWRETDAIRAEPLYLAPIAPQPALDAADLAFIADELRQDRKNRAAYLGLTAMAYPTQPAEPVAKTVSVTQKWQDGDDSNMVSRVADPVKVTSDADIDGVWRELTGRPCIPGSTAHAFAHALLTRYGATTQEQP